MPNRGIRNRSQHAELALVEGSETLHQNREGRRAIETEVEQHEDDF